MAAPELNPEFSESSILKDTRNSLLCPGRVINGVNEFNRGISQAINLVKNTRNSAQINLLQGRFMLLPELFFDVLRMHKNVSIEGICATELRGHYAQKLDSDVQKGKKVLLVHSNSVPACFLIEKNTAFRALEKYDRQLEGFIKQEHILHALASSGGALSGRIDPNGTIYFDKGAISNPSTPFHQPTHKI